MGERQKRVTSLDVAREAGTSRTTISYVFNDDPRIPAVTRDRVLAAARRLGYQPYGPARMLRGGRSRIVLMVTPTIAEALDPIGASIVDRLGRELARAGLHLVWQLGFPGQDDLHHELRPQVVLSSAAGDSTAVADLRSRFDVPVLPAFPGLTKFTAAAAHAQAEHCYTQGHRRLAFVSPAAPQFRFTGDVRQAAVETFCAERGLPAPQAVVMASGRAGARDALRLVLDAPEPATAVCAYNDGVAGFLLAAALDLGVGVPDRLAVLGVDNHPWGEMMTPPLTTVSAATDRFVLDMADNVRAAAAGTPLRDVELPSRFAVVRRESA